MSSIPPMRRCSKCQQEFPATLEYFKKQKYGKYGLASHCIKCAQEYQHEHYLKRKAWEKSPPPPEKVCSQCGELKPIEQFNHSDLSRDGHNPRCKQCLAQYHREHSEIPEVKRRRKERDAEWYLENREEVRRKQNTRYHGLPKDRANGKSSKECTQCHRGLPLSKFHNKRDAADGKASICAKCKYNYDKVYKPEYWKRPIYKLIMSKANATRRARLAQADGSYTKEDVLVQVKAQTDKKGTLRCWWCNCHIEDAYHVDHRVPLARGGSNNADNLVISCPSCNMSRGAKLPSEWNGRLL